MPGVDPVMGELPAQVMAVLWRLEAGTVEQVRGALPSHCRGAHTTVRTALNRLAEGGFLTREREGRAFVYRPEITETQYLVGIIQRTLAAASPDARLIVLAQLISDLPDHASADLLRFSDALDAKRKGARPR